MTKENATPFDLAATVHRKLKSAKIKPLPSQAILTSLFECMYFASLKTEEGQFIRVTITLISSVSPDPNPPERKVANRWKHVKFSRKIPLDLKNLVKISKAADPSCSSLAVYYDDEDKLFIWGMIDQAVHYQNYLNYEVESGAEMPGIVQVSITDIASIVVLFDYQLIGKLNGNILITNYLDIFKKGYIYEILKRNSVNMQKQIGDYLSENFSDNGRDKYWETIVEKKAKECLSRLLLKIQSYHHGGAILITQNKTENLEIKYRLHYSRLRDCVLNYSKLAITNTYYSDKIQEEYLEEKSDSIPADLYLDDKVSEFEREETRDELNGIIKFIASLSCVDGLIAIDTEFNILGFGAFIQAKIKPEKIYISKTSSINETKLIELDSAHFGTRHRSIFAYCWKYPGSIGFVISQDGDIRVVTKYNDKLIMWENIKVNQYSVSKRMKLEAAASEKITV